VVRVHQVPLDDTTLVTFRLINGATASLLTMTATVPTYRLQVFGTRARIQVDGSADLRGSETMEVTSLSDERTVKCYAALDVEHAELEAFADAVAGRRPYPISNLMLLTV